MLCSICVVLEYWKNYPRGFEFLSTLILFGGGFLLPEVLFAWPTPPGWFRQSQGISILFVCHFALCWLLRHKITLARNGDVEQIVGPERRERDSHQNWSGQG
jgi:hypothetical protein